MCSLRPRHRMSQAHIIFADNFRSRHACRCSTEYTPAIKVGLLKRSKSEDSAAEPGKTPTVKLDDMSHHFQQAVQESRPAWLTSRDQKKAYPCTCNGVASECPFCTVTTTSAEGTVCQQSGESSTFTFNTDSPQLMICTCNYYGSGSVNQTCVPQAAVLDTLVPAPPPLPSAGPAPTAAPGTKAPGTGEGTLTPEVPNPSLTSMGCHAITPYNVRICLGTPEECAQYGASCAIMGQHSCACTGSSDTMCSYCQVQTATEMFCQVVGSSSTFTGLDGVKKTCTCDYAGNGQATQTCTPVPTMDISGMP